MPNPLLAACLPSKATVVALILSIGPALLHSAELTAPEPLGEPATKAYRQIMPDGRIVYSDKVLDGAKVDETLSVDPPIKGNVWTAVPGTRPAIPAQTTSTPVNRVSSIPVPGKGKTLDDANADVTRAEMLLEDARKRQEAGLRAIAGEQTGDPAYQARQKKLAEEVAAVESALRQSINERNALRNRR